MEAHVSRHAIRSGMAALWLLCAAQPHAAAQGLPTTAFPAKPVTVIVPFAPGGPTDIVMRALAPATEKHLGQAIVVENRTGAGGTLGPAQMAKAKPDGYTLAQLPVTVFRYPFMTSTSFDPAKDFTYVIA